MIKKEELKSLVKKYFNLVEIKAASATLLDGTEVTNDLEGDLEVGQILYVVTPDGNLIAPAGSHETETFVVDVDSEGIITAIVEREEARVRDVEMEAEVPAIVEEIVGADEAANITSDIEGMVESLVENAIEHVVEAIAGEMIELKKRMKEMEDMYNKMSAAAPTLEQKFNKIQNIKKEKHVTGYDAREAQMSLVLSSFNNRKK